MKNEKVKSNLHPRNKHKFGYDFDKLIAVYPELKQYVGPNKYGNISINFFDPNAVKALNSALLRFHYKVEYWSVPDPYLIPPIPGRVDYVHYIADLIKSYVPKGHQVRGLDIGCGANCIYSLLGVKEYDWEFVGTEVDTRAIKSAQNIIDKNEGLEHKIAIRKQQNKDSIIEGIMLPNDSFDFTICNPPFHKSESDVIKENLRKNRNLSKGKMKNVQLNFKGKSSELWYEGGEIAFIRKLIKESRTYAKQVKWFTTLVSREEHLFRLYQILESVKPAEIRTIEMGQGQKKSRILAWTFDRK